MKKIGVSLYLIAMAFLAGAKTAQEIAKSLPAPTIDEKTQKISVPAVDGAEVKLLGADYKDLVCADGSLKPVISETPIRLSYCVIKDGQSAWSDDFTIVLGKGKVNKGNAKPSVIPELLTWQGGDGFFKLKDNMTVQWLGASCNNQESLDVFIKDIEKTTGKKISTFEKCWCKFWEKPDFSFELTNEDFGKEGYQLEISSTRVKVSASTINGLIWGARTIVQLSKQGDIPCGVAFDLPRYPVRGFMFDIARTPYPLSFLRDIVEQMSWFKMNDLHLVINNNYIFHEHYVKAGHDPMKESYSAFRLESDVKGADGTALTAKDLSYSKEEFMDFISYAKARGVTIVPEFDTPGHALSFTRVRPDLVYQGPMNHVERRCEMLDAANPETIKFVSKVFDEYLLNDAKFSRAVFADCPVIHVGSDEFFGDKESYRFFADAILRHVLSRHYTPRIWGSLRQKPGKTPVVSDGVQMNIWSAQWMSPTEAIKLGYDIINTHDGALYIVPFAGYYRMDRNHKGLYNNWQVNKIGSETIPAGHPKLLGATFAIWNDETGAMHTGYGALDLWPIISNSIDIMSQKLWTSTTPRSFEEHKNLVKKLGDAPNANPLYTWGNKEKVIVEKIDSLPLALNKPALGPDYHLTMEFTLEECQNEQILLSGAEGTLFASMADGTVGFRRDDTLEFSYNVNLPIGKKIKLELLGAMQKTTLIVDGATYEKPELKTCQHLGKDFFKRHTNARSTFVLPLQTLGESFKGKIHSLQIEAK